MPSRRMLYSCMAIMTLAGAALGAVFGTLMRPTWGAAIEPSQRTLFSAGLLVAGALVGCLLSSCCCRALVGVTGRLCRAALLDKLAALIGLLIGLTVGVLASTPLTVHVPGVLPLRTIVVLVSAALGVALGLSARQQLLHVFPALATRLPLPERQVPARSKVLDPSIVIQGRIDEICKAGFVEGPLLLPQFVLQELHRTADSEDSVERALGRRALETLNRLKALPRADLRVYDEDTVHCGAGEDIGIRLVKLAREVGAEVLTNNTVVVELARVHGVSVLALDELVHALHREVLSGEELVVTIVAEGKQTGQGVAYIDDRTMVVVEGAAHLLGRRAAVTIARTLQTKSGRTLFGALSADAPAAERSSRGSQESAPSASRVRSPSDQ